MSAKLPTWKILVGLLLLALISVLIVVTVDAIDPAAGASVSRQHISILPPKDPSPKVWGKLMASNMRHGKLGNSKGRYLPAKMVHRLNTYKSKHPRVPDWWTGAMGKAECMFNGDIFPGPPITDLAFCLKYGDNPTIHKINKTIMKIQIGCQAGMVMGALSGEPIGVITGGAAGCAFVLTAQTILDSPFFMHSPKRPVP